MSVLLFGDVIPCEYLLIPAINLLHHLRPQELRWELRWSREIWKSLKQNSLCPASAANQHTRAPQEHNPGFPRLSFCPVRLSTSRKGHNTHTSDPRTGVPSLQPSLLSPQGRCLCSFSFSTAGALSPTLLLFFPSYPIICTTFLHSGLYKSPSAIFQLVFNENHLLCRYVFDMFLGLAELHILLLYTMLVYLPSYTTKWLF